MKMIPNCNLEAVEWIGYQDKKDLYMTSFIIELAGKKLEKTAQVICSKCELYDDCMPRPIYQNDKFVGVKTQI